MKIRVPATSANLGPGFDSCGIAVDSYLTIEIGKPSEKWMIHHDLGSEIPTDETNLLIETAKIVASYITPHIIYMDTDIPMTRGLGSSSSVIIAGIELANYLENLGLSKQEKINIATQMEGHPDNVVPAICGGFVVASYIDDEVIYLKSDFPECSLIAYIPEEKLLTTTSRNVLPKNFDYANAVKASSIANVMVAHILKGNLELAGKMMEKDLFHEKFRKELVPQLEQIRKINEKLKGYAVYLSGAGTTIMILTPEEKREEFINELQKLPYNAEIRELNIDTKGACLIAE
ncbi:MAG: homoserine kinase [Clostridioides sp.]|jgi:homoserine kinase|nr:homoserine kinase [Clostridioides sp.]